MFHFHIAKGCFLLIYDEHFDFLKIINLIIYF